MENMNQLKDLLKHEIKDLYSAEEQIIEALPKMIEKANNKSLKKALEDHLRVTGVHKDRLDEVLEHLDEEGEEKEGGFLSGLFKSKEKCKATEGLIKEGEKLMEEDMSPEVMDAAIIAAAQKIEHYEIASYGTVRTYARELNLNEVESLLTETLDEEYASDDLLTALAESRINERAITGEERHGGRSGSRRISSASSAGKSKSRSAATANASKGRASSSRNGGGAPAKKASSARSSSGSAGNGRSAPAKKSSSRNKTSSGRGRAGGRSSR
jgi:ferritin-like metal-binding protein YciE